MAPQGCREIILICNPSKQQQMTAGSGRWYPLASQLPCLEGSSLKYLDSWSRGTGLLTSQVRLQGDPQPVAGISVITLVASTATPTTTLIISADVHFTTTAATE
jgi:hypothetical protein